MLCGGQKGHYIYQYQSSSKRFGTTGIVAFCPLQYSDSRVSTPRCRKWFELCGIRVSVSTEADVV